MCVDYGRVVIAVASPGHAKSKQNGPIILPPRTHIKIGEGWRAGRLDRCYTTIRVQEINPSTVGA